MSDLRRKKLKATIKRYWKFLLVILAALAIGVLGGAIAHKLGYFSVVKALLLSPVAQQEPADMSQETEPLGSVFDHSSMQVLHFTDETAVEFVPVLEADRKSLSQRYALPPLERMNETDTAELMAPRQVLRRIQALGIDPETFDTPEANWKDLYNSVMSSVQPLAEATGETVAFEGSTAGDLNQFLAGVSGKVVEITSSELTMDETIQVPSGVVLHGNGVRLIAGAEILDKAIVLDRAENTAVTGIVITEGCRYGIYVKNSDLYYLAGNDISGAEYKGITIMGDNSRFAIVNNEVHGNGNGAVFLNGNISYGVIEANRILDNSGARNLTAGLVLCSIPIEDIETAYNPFPDELLENILESPHCMVVRGNTVSQNHSSGIYSDSGYLNYYVENTLYKNEKEGMCLDYGSFGNYVSGNVIRQNGGRNRMSDEDLEADFVLELGRLDDGSSPAKLPGISLDNTAYNIIYNNVILENYGSGVKAVRSAFCNTILGNTITDNNLGVSDQFHFFGVELSTDLNADQEVQGLDFTPCYQNIIARNIISGPHFSGIFLGEEAFMNDMFDNVIMGCSDWSIESLSGLHNSNANNLSDMPARGLDSAEG